MDTDRPFITFNFDVSMEVANADVLGLSSPLCGASFAECDGLEMTMEPKVVKAGGSNISHIHLVGPVTYSNLTLKRGMTGNLDMWLWFIGAAQGQYRGSRATGTVLMNDASGSPSLRFTLQKCLPVKIKAASLNAKDGAIALEELQIAYESFTVELADDSSGDGAGISLSAGIGVGGGISASASLSLG